MSGRPIKRTLRGQSPATRVAPRAGARIETSATTTGTVNPDGRPPCGDRDGSCLRTERVRGA